jgi:(E)-4-hydroxy-3-methylbut-2-enyl-diphosphate synthase
MDLSEEKSVPYPRRTTIQVNIGNVPMGSNYPIRIQSMANTLTSDIPGSVAQCIRIINAGADFVRLTVPSLADADAFAAIKRRLLEEGYTTPLAADVHFNPDIALKVADFADKVRINPGNFSDLQKFRMLIEKCRSRKVALRIGVNHGSLSEKIMDLYGDTPEGMAESAMEYLRICKERGFDQVVVSMKASNVRIMIFATRLVADMMDNAGMPFPLHLGVTEAGEGEDGRIKSAVGIGALLAEGLGDTIRVSLTEEPEAEVPVARQLAVERRGEGESGRTGEGEKGEGRRSFEYNRRKSRIIVNIGGNNPPLVYGFDPFPENVHLIHAGYIDLTGELFDQLLQDKAILVYKGSLPNTHAELQGLRKMLEERKCDVPVIFCLNLEERNAKDFMLKAAAGLGGAFIDGFGDGIWLSNSTPLSRDVINNTALGILQAARTRMSKTEYISCPSCGRTNFNLIETLARIKQATIHLTGLKIGVMGCIVNGPGEMADADYGYVGAGKGKVTLYKAKEVVKRNISEDQAVEELVRLIKENGDWIVKK